jgi:hypothetical protein
VGLAGNAAGAHERDQPAHPSVRGAAVRVGNLLLVAGIAYNPWLLGAAVLCIVASLALQKVGHAMEPVEVHPFTVRATS